MFPILFNMSCASSHCVYLIECLDCPVRYVGQSSNPLRQRISQHLRDIRNAVPTSPLVPHFTEVHPVTSLRFFAIDRCFVDSHRLIKEQKWICTLRTARPSGLNKVLAAPKRHLNLTTYHADCTARLNSFIRQTCRDVSDLTVRFSYRTDRNLRSLLA